MSLKVEVFYFDFDFFFVFGFGKNILQSPWKCVQL